MKRFLSPWLLAALCVPAHGATDLADLADLADLSIDQLLNVAITTASKKEQKLSETPAAVFVLSHDDIQRSGATSLPELLLALPGVEGGAINAHSAAVGIRGLGGQWSNKLVVLIDGRSIYTRTFSGVYWDSHNIPFEDIERIEVIRGANTALWGANAMNGVINIITRDSGATQGTLLRGSVGTHDSGDLLARQGLQIGERGFARVYASGERQGDSAGHPDGEADDNWNGKRAGLRGDWDSAGGARLMVQADLYALHTHNNPIDPAAAPPNAFTLGAGSEPTADTHGHALLVNFTQAYALASEWSLQFAWSRASRDEFVPTTENSYDFDAQHHFQPRDGHDLVWGVNVRYRRDDTDPTPNLSFIPDEAEDTNSSLFFQDEIAFADGRAHATIGARFEYDEHNQWVIQPSLRALWNIGKTQKLWAAVARAARTPSRTDRDMSADLPAVYPVPHYGSLPITIQLRGNPDFKTEHMLSYELGYRAQPIESVALDLALYWNRYDQLRVVEYNGEYTFEGGAIIAPMRFGNSLDGEVYGGELAVSWTPTSNLRLQAFWGETRLALDSPRLALADYRVSDELNESSPARQLGLRADWDFAARWSTLLQLKYVAAMDHPFNNSFLDDNRVPSYLDCDLNLLWRITPQWQLALLGKNLLDRSRLEYASEAGATPTEARRTAHLRATWSF